MPLPAALVLLAPLAPRIPLVQTAEESGRPREDWVYYDWVDERGALRGGRVRVVERPSEEEVGPGAAADGGSGVVTLLDNGPVENRLDVVFVGDGYTASQLGTYANHVNTIWPVLLSEPPLDEYVTYFNVHKVDVVSNQSGVDNDPVPGIVKDTALDMEFWCQGIDRLLCVNTGKAGAKAGLAPDSDQVLALANSTTYGGAGYTQNDLATISGGNFSSIEIALHELGHALGDLADEYDYGGPLTYAGPEPVEPNASTYTASLMGSLDVKWHLWLGSPGVGTFQGAMYSSFGIYRPTVNSKMRNLGQPFDPINTEQLIAQLYGVVDPIDDATPFGTYDPDVQLFVDPLDPVSHALKVQWLLDGAELPGATSAAFDVGTLALGPGLHTVSARVTDPTTLVRDEALRAELLTEERAWTIAVPGNPQPPVATAVAGGGWISGAGAISVSGAFLDTVTAARVGGAPATIVSQSFDALELAAGALAPGPADVELDGAGGTALVPDAITVAPTLAVATTGIGGTLTAGIDMASAFNGLYALAISGAAYPAPLVVPGIYHGLELNLATAFTVVGSGLFLESVELVYPVPSQPSLSGATLYLQGFVTRYSLPFENSFTDLRSVVF
jgi:hypothetical protein